MQFTLEASEMQQAQVMVGEIAADLVGERRTLAASVDALLDGGWSGVAAEDYREAWSDWREAADQVLEALRAVSELLGQSRASYLASDDSSVATTAPVGSRLQERLS